MGLPCSPTDPGPLSRAVSPLLPVPYMAQGVEWAFKIPIRKGSRHTGAVSLVFEVLRGFSTSEAP